MVFNPGDTQKWVGVTINGDQDPEPTETILLSMGTPSGSAVLGANRTHVIMIVDDAADTDGDGMPDWWEMLHFAGTTNALPDADEEPDGWNNLQEFMRGGNPTNAWVPDTGDDLDLRIRTPLR